MLLAAGEGPRKTDFGEKGRVDGWHDCEGRADTGISLPGKRPLVDFSKAALPTKLVSVFMLRRLFNLHLHKNEWWMRET